MSSCSRIAALGLLGALSISCGRKEAPAKQAQPSSATTPQVHTSTPTVSQATAGAGAAARRPASSWDKVRAEVKRQLRPKRSKDSAARHRKSRLAALATLTEASPSFKLRYGPAEDKAQKVLQDKLKADGQIDAMVPQLNKLVRLKFPLMIQITACGEANAYYDAPPATSDGKLHPGEITLCVEFMEHMLTLFAEDAETSEQAAEEMMGAVWFTFFHELGHALTDNLKLAVTGKEEDAVDQLATLLLLRLGERGADAALAAATAFRKEHEDTDEEDIPLWDEHSLDGQRMYEMLCLIYGSSPEDYEDLIGKDGLPKERAEGCEETYEAAVRAWDKLLRPHLKGVNTLRFKLKKAPQKRPQPSAPKGK